MAANVKGQIDMTDIVSLQGPVELLDGKLVLQIPLEVGGSALHEVARKISTVDDECLTIPIPDWLAEKLGITDGTLVAVDNRNGKFNITLVGSDDEPR